MFDYLLTSIFNPENAMNITLVSFFTCTITGILLGLFMAKMYAHKTKCTKGFMMTLALLPFVVAMVIIMVNGNIGVGVAVVGAFSLVRFRSINVDKNIDKGTVYIILDNAHISNAELTPINIVEAQNIEIMLKGNNSVTQGNISKPSLNFPSAAIYSKADTTIIGEGNLSVTANYQDDINSRDDLIISNANISVKAVEDDIVGKDLLEINKANITVEAGKDGLNSSNDEKVHR